MMSTMRSASGSVTVGASVTRDSVTGGPSTAGSSTSGSVAGGCVAGDSVAVGSSSPSSPTEGSEAGVTPLVHDASRSITRTPCTSRASAAAASGSSSGASQSSVPSWPENDALVPSIPASASSTSTRFSRSFWTTGMKMAAPIAKVTPRASPPVPMIRRRYRPWEVGSDGLMLSYDRRSERPDQRRYEIVAEQDRGELHHDPRSHRDTRPIRSSTVHRRGRRCRVARRVWRRFGRRWSVGATRSDDRRGRFDRQQRPGRRHLRHHPTDADQRSGARSRNRATAVQPHRERRVRRRRPRGPGRTAHRHRRCADRRPGRRDATNGDPQRVLRVRRTDRGAGDLRVRDRRRPPRPARISRCSIRARSPSRERAASWPVSTRRPPTTPPASTRSALASHRASSTR